ncbi:MAG: sensor histidine kinase [Myxococcota bacterium]
MREALQNFFDPPVSADPVHGAAKLAWIVRLRWIALIAQLAAIAPGVHFQLLEPRFLPLFVGVIVGLALVNAGSWAALRRGYEPRQRDLLIQLGLDVGGTSVLLAISGGAWNPLVPILFVHAGLGALLLEGTLSVFFFAVLLGTLLFLQLFAQIPPGLANAPIPAVILFPAQLLVAVGFWFLTAWLSRTLGLLQRDFALRRDRETRIDRLRAVGALAAGLSHELATPLNTAQLRLGRLARERGLNDDPELAVAREALKRCGEVLRQMAGAPLRPEGLSLEVVDVDGLVREVCSGVSAAEFGEPIRVVTRGRGGRFCVIPRLAFTQGLLNLIDNAIEASDGPGDVEVRVDRGRDRIDVSVCDRGDGWPEVVKVHLGQPFVTTRAHGVGLGLYFVHTLSQAIGGEFHVEDREEGGAVARISLPASHEARPYAA